jgi:hypothetical protein
MFSDELDGAEEEADMIEHEVEVRVGVDGLRDCPGCGGVIREDVCPGCGYHEEEME